MFSTFSSDLNPTDTHTAPNKSSAPRSKRSQVAHACDWCRVNRVKCDDEQPCQQCRQRGGQCSNSKLATNASLPAANREILRLRDQVKNLEGQLKESEKATAAAQAHVHAVEQQVLQQQQLPTPDSVSAERSWSSLPLEPRKTWEGDPGADAVTGQVLFHGPLSLPYLVTRMHRYLHQELQTPSLDFSVSQVACPQAATLASEDSPLPDIDVLSRAQEESFLYPFWESFHPIYPTLSAVDFRLHYDSLWTAGQPRRPSALVDSMLAVCTQYCSTFLHSDEDGFEKPPGSDVSDISRVGHSFYLRSQSILLGELETPTIATVWSYSYCVIYLHTVSLHNTAYEILGTAIRVAQSLRLHLRPLPGTPPEQQELHSRVWWTLYQLDSVISMSLGRPPLIRLEDVTCALPRDTDDSSHPSDTMLRSPAHPDINWLSFHVQYVRLTAAVHTVNTAVQEKCDQLVRNADSQDIYEEPHMLESLAAMVDREVGVIQEWVRRVPDSLKARRRSSAEPFSTDRVSLNLDSTGPLWLRRQQVLLEISYHALQLSVRRPFLSFLPKKSSFMPLADHMSTGALNHAITLTNLIHQVLSESDLLRGWLAVFQYQWDATLCMLGFVIGNPVCPCAPAARKSLQTAIRSLDAMSHYYPAARSASQIARYFYGLGEALTDRYRQGIHPRGSSISGPSTGPKVKPGTPMPEVLPPPVSTYIPTSVASTAPPFIDPSLEHFQFGAMNLDMLPPNLDMNLHHSHPDMALASSLSAYGEMLPDAVSMQQWVPPPSWET